MIFFVKNFIRSVLVHIKVNLIILFDLILCALVVFVLLQNFYFLKEKHDEFFYDDRVAKNYSLQVDSQYYEQIENDVWNKTNMGEQGLKMYYEINSTELSLYQTNYYYLVTSNLDEDTRSKIGDISEFELMSISDFAMDAMKLKLSEGRYFVFEEFTNLGTIEYYPIIMGSGFKDSFKLGDVIYYSDEIANDKAVIVGFLESNQVLEGYGMVQEEFDYLILTPFSGEFPRTNLDPDMVDRERVRMFNFGILFSPDENFDVQKYINQLTSKYGYYTVEAMPIDGTSFSETKSISERNLYLIGILTILTTVICTVSLSGVLYNRTLNDRRTFCIYMSSGIPIWKINASLIIEMIFWIVISIIPVGLISVCEFDTVLIPLWQIILFLMVVIGVSIMPSLYLNTKCNIDLLIRNQMT